MGTKHRGTREEVRALDAYIKLMRAADTLQGVMDQRLGGLGLTENQFGVLETLLHLGPLHQNALGEKLLVSKGNVTVIVDNLERRGLVRRERDTHDRRHVTVGLTEQGRALIGQVFPGHVDLIVRALEVLEPGEQEILAALCKKLGLGVRARSEAEAGGLVVV
ncbi:MAG: MarR family transcriptional regulator [Meiothermus sp.]